MAQRVGRGVALLFHNRGTRRRMSGQQHALAALYPRKRPGIHFTGSLVGPRAGLDGRKSKYLSFIKQEHSLYWTKSISTHLLFHVKHKLAEGDPNFNIS